MPSIGVIELVIILLICALFLVVIGAAIFLLVIRKRPGSDRDHDQG
jgi:maltodextrin utilization protein YvdJ